MSSAQKKVILRRFAGDVAHGYLPANGFVQNAAIPFLNLEGRLMAVPLDEVKSVCFVRDFNLADRVDPERLHRRTFPSRPRGDGLWVRIIFREGSDVLEGVCPADESLLDQLTLDLGLFLTPPDTRSNTQRVYVPRSAMESMAVVGYITSPSRRPALLDAVAGPPQPETKQVALFDGVSEVPRSRKKGSYGAT